MEFNYDYTHVKLYCQEFKKKTYQASKLNDEFENKGKCNGHRKEERAISLSLSHTHTHTHTNIYFTLLPADYRTLVSALLGDRNSLE